MAVNLTEGAIRMLSNGEWQTVDLKPVLQILDVRMVKPQTSTGGSGENKDRYRVLLSDGVFHQQGMLATQRNELVTSEVLQKGSIVQLTEFVCNAIRERVIIIIINLEVILGNCDIIGDAKPFLLQHAGGETPPVERSAPPMQPPSNPPPSTVSDAQSSNVGPPAGSVIRPHSNVVSFNNNPTSNRPTFTPFKPEHVAATLPQPSNNHMPPVQLPYNRPHSNVTSFNNNPTSNRPTFTPFKPEHVAAPPPQPSNNHMLPVQPPYNRPPPMYANRGPIAKNEAPPRVIPIAALNPYQGKWTIKARVTVKGELRRYNNAKGDGKVFSFDLLDSDGGEIRATCFNAVADQFYNQIEVGKVYYISKGTIKPAQKAFNHLKNDFEITLDNSSTAQLCFDDDTSIPRQQFHFRSISEVEDMESNNVIDVIGVVTSVNPATSIMRKNGAEAKKRSLFLKDMSGRSIELTLWGDFCDKEGQTLQEMSDSGVFPILAVKSAKTYEFNGKTLSTISSSQVCIDPDFSEAQNLKTWFESVGRNTPSISMSRESGPKTDVWKTISQIKDEKLGTSEKPDYITVNATIWQMKLDNFCYTACPITIGERKCSKKVVDNGDGKWRCDKCDKVVDECDYRYILQILIQDHTGSIWTTAFQETGEEIMGVSAKDLYFMRHEEQDEERFTEIIRGVYHNEYSFKLKVKEETWAEEHRVKSIVVKVEKMKFSANTKMRLLEIQKMQENPGLGLGGFRETSPVGIGQQGGLPAGQVGQYGGPGGRVDGVVSSGGGSGECYRCHQTGHWARDCPGVSNGPPSYGMPSGGGGNSGGSGECYKCHQMGHWARDCPVGS